MTFDDIRALYPGLGLALYALEPGGPVVLELILADETVQFTGPTAQAAIDLAFPPPTAEDLFG